MLFLDLAANSTELVSGVTDAATGLAVVLVAWIYIFAISALRVNMLH